MFSTGFFIACGVFIAANALAGVLLWKDSRERKWSDRPLWQFVIVTIAALTPLMLITAKVVAGGFGNLTIGG